MSTTENLISAVYKRPAIWDPKHYLHKNRSAIQIIWEEIAAEVGMDSSTLKHKWKILREFHRTELKRMKSLRKTLDPNESQSHLPAWEFFPLMSFLNDTVTSRSRCHHLPPLESTRSLAIRDSIGGQEGDELNVDNLGQNDNEAEGGGESEIKMKDDAGKKPTEEDEGREIVSGNVSHFLPSIWGKNDKRNFKTDYLEKLIELEKRKMIQYEREREDEDEDLMFFKSFLPDMRTLPRVRKLYLKLKFQELLYNEISNTEGDGANTEATGSMDKSIID